MTGAGHGKLVTHGPQAGAGHTQDPATDQPARVTHTSGASGSSNPVPGQSAEVTQSRLAGSGPNSATDHSSTETQGSGVGRGPLLDDPFLKMAADVLADLEGVRVANENRLRQFTRSEEDSDGDERGFGLEEDHPEVVKLRAIVDGLVEQERHAELNLKRVMRKHPLGPWVKGLKGVGEKTAARLLAAIGDPYWNDSLGRSALVSELWSYCGYGDAKLQVRKKGTKANWSADAKKRAYLVAASCMKQLKDPCYSLKDEDGKYAGAVHVEDCVCSPYRVVYDQAREKHAKAVHLDPCVRCGPKGKPAPAGSPVSGNHQQARALRAVSKRLLKDLWIEAKRLHELQD